MVVGLTRIAKVVNFNINKHEKIKLTNRFEMKLILGGNDESLDPIDDDFASCSAACAGENLLLVKENFVTPQTT